MILADPWVEDWNRLDSISLTLVLWLFFFNLDAVGAIKFIFLTLEAFGVSSSSWIELIDLLIKTCYKLSLEAYWILVPSMLSLLLSIWLKSLNSTTLLLLSEGDSIPVLCSWIWISYDSFIGKLN